MSAGQQVIGLFMAGMAVGQIPFGLVSDRIGRLPVLYFGIGLSSQLAGFVTSISDDISVMLVCTFRAGHRLVGRHGAGARHGARRIQRCRGGTPDVRHGDGVYRRRRCWRRCSALCWCRLMGWRLPFRGDRRRRAAGPPQACTRLAAGDSGKARPRPHDASPAVVRVCAEFFSAPAKHLRGTRHHDDDARHHGR